MDLGAALDDAVDRRFDDIVGWIVDLVRTPSVTGDEHAAQQGVETLLHELGMAVEVITPGESLRDHPSFSDDGLPVDRPVVLGVRRGADPQGRSLVLNGHVDVVPTGDEAAFPHGPWSGAVRDGELWGRGSCDMKAGLVAGIAALVVLDDLDVQPPGDVVIESVTGEESGGVGTLATVVAGHTADAAVVLEPTSLALCPVGAGSASFRLHVHGRAAHGATRSEGVSAIEKFAVLDAAMRSFESGRHAGWSHPAFTSDGLVAPISVGRVIAGDWPSTVPERLVAEGRYGVFPGETLEATRLAFERMVAEVVDADPWLRAHPPEIEWFEGQFEPAETSLDADIVESLRRLHTGYLGDAPAVHGVPYGSDLRFFTNDLGIPALLYGPGDVRLAHTVTEHIELDEVRAATHVIAELVATWGRRPAGPG